MVLDLTALEGIPELLLPENINSILIIEGGLNNRNILLNDTLLLKEYLQRDEKNDPVQLRYLREKKAFSSFKNLDFIPLLLNSYEDDSKYFIGRNWVEGEIYSLKDFEKNPNGLITTLSSLHNQKYICHGDYDYFDVIERYLREYDHLSINKKLNLPDVAKINSFYVRRKKELDLFSEKNQSTRIHGDLVFSNIINFDENCVFIDWEYTTYGDPLIDLAYLITQNSMPVKLENILIRHYEEHNSLKINLHSLSVYKDLMNLMSSLWYSLQVFRIHNNTSTHSETDTSGINFKDLAIQGFAHLEIF